mmetsp:Transcript_45198/g.106663  ORF Transcript_45198/g.106663 Transcript_45198/m.106663 type:complete len:210 (+) Transcript_45198:412-1041(+)
MLWVADCCMRVLPAVHERCLLAQLHVVECDLRNATGGSRVEKMWPTSYETGRDYAETRELAPPLLYTRFNLLATPLFSLPPLPLHYPSVSLRSLASLCTFHASLPSRSLFCSLSSRHCLVPSPLPPLAALSVPLLHLCPLHCAACGTACGPSPMEITASVCRRRPCRKATERSWRTGTRSWPHSEPRCKLSQEPHPNTNTMEESHTCMR